MDAAKHTIAELIQNPKFGLMVGGSTTVTGAVTWFNWIPDDIGKLASLVGLILSVLLIIVHSRRLIRTVFPKKEDESCTNSSTSTPSDTSEKASSNQKKS